MEGAESDDAPAGADAVPPGLTQEVLVDRLFKKACRNECVSLAELRECDVLVAKIAKVQQLRDGGSFSPDEYIAKIFDLVGAGPEAIDDTVARYAKRQAVLVETVLQARQILKDEMEGKMPVPPEVDTEDFFSAEFEKACHLYNVTLSDVCKFEHLKIAFLRLKRLRADERILDVEYTAKVEQLFDGVQGKEADEKLRDLHKEQLELIEKLLAAMQTIKHTEWQAAEAAELAQIKHNQYVEALRQQVERKVAKERHKAESVVARRRAALEKVLIRRGVEQTVREVEKADRYLATPYLRKKASAEISWIPKTTAGQERKKLWLIDRNYKAQAKTKFDSSLAFSHIQHEKMQSLQPRRPMSALERREFLLHEKEDKIRSKESRKAHESEMVMKEKEAELRKQQHKRNLKKIQAENAMKRMESAREQRADHVMNKLNMDANRLAAFKEMQLQQRIAIAAIQKQARDEDAVLKAILVRAECDFEYRPEGLGIDFDKIERHVNSRSTRLLRTSDSVFTPELEVPLPRTRPSSAAQEKPASSSSMKRHLRPSSAPPGGPAHSSQPHMTQRPATAATRSTRTGASNSGSRPGTASSRLKGMPEDGIPDDISDISEEDDAESLRMARLEKLRIEQGTNLYHIVQEEQVLEKERLRMLSAVHPNKVGHLNRSGSCLCARDCAHLAGSTHATLSKSLQSLTRLCLCRCLCLCLCLCVRVCGLCACVQIIRSRTAGGIRAHHAGGS